MTNEQKNQIAELIKTARKAGREAVAGNIIKYLEGCIGANVLHECVNFCANVQCADGDCGESCDCDQFQEDLEMYVDVLKITKQW